MANLSPIDWGGPVQADQQGVEEARATTAQVGGATSQATRELGVDVSGLGQAAAQGILHSQALAATAAVKERQADTLQFIEGHPYVPKSLLQQRMAPDDYAQWDAAVGSNSQWKDKNIVPMYTVAGHLFDSEAKQARTDAGNLIGLPGWRGAWSSTEQAESSTVRERYVNRMAANQMVEDNSASDATSIDKVIDKATTPADFDTAAKMAEGSTWLHPNVKKAYQERALQAKDAFPVQESIRSKDVGLMKQQLDRLQGPDAAKYFSNSTPQQREVLEEQLSRVYGFRAAKQIANGLVSSNIQPNGKVDATAIDKAVAGYSGDNKEEVVKAANAQTNEALRLWDDKTSQAQQALHTLGQDPKTGDFSYSTMYEQNPEAVERLNRDSPGKLTALKSLDVRAQRQQDTKDRQAAQDAKEEQTVDSGLNVRRIDEYFDDPSNADEIGRTSKAQFDSRLLDEKLFPGGWTKGDREYARRQFDQVQVRGGMPDPRIMLALKSEVNNAAQGNSAVERQLMSKFQDSLLARSHAFVRANTGLPADKMVDALRGELKKELLKGSVIGGGSLFGDANKVRRIEWEENPTYMGLDFKDSDGNVVPAATPISTPTRVKRR